MGLTASLNRRAAIAGLAGTALAMPYVRPSWAQAGTVNIYNWADYIGGATIIPILANAS